MIAFAFVFLGQVKDPVESAPMIFRAAALAFCIACPLFFVEVDRGKLFVFLRGSAESEPQDGPPAVEKVGEPDDSPAGEGGCAESTACDCSPPARRSWRFSEVAALSSACRRRLLRASCVAGFHRRWCPCRHCRVVVRSRVPLPRSGVSHPRGRREVSGVGVRLTSRAPGSWSLMMTTCVSCTSVSPSGRSPMVFGCLACRGRSAVRLGAERLCVRDQQDGCRSCAARRPALRHRCFQPASQRR